MGRHTSDVSLLHYFLGGPDPQVRQASNRNLMPRSECGMAMSLAAAGLTTAHDTIGHPADSVFQFTSGSATVPIIQQRTGPQWKHVTPP